MGGGVYKSRVGCLQTPLHYPLVLLWLLELNRTARDAPAGRDWTGATPPLFDRWRGQSRGGVYTGVYTGVDTPLLSVVGVAPVRIYPCGKAPRRPDGHDQDDDQDEARNPAGCRPVLAGNRGETFALTCDRPQRAGRVTRRAGAQRRTAQPLTPSACGVYSGCFPWVRGDF